jgi:hypothetical protein
MPTANLAPDFLERRPCELSGDVHRDLAGKDLGAPTCARRDPGGACRAGRSTRTRSGGAIGSLPGTATGSTTPLAHRSLARPSARICRRTLGRTAGGDGCHVALQRTDHCCLVSKRCFWLVFST